MSESIFFSIVIAVRNGDKFIAETLESILNQTYYEFELIVVNDGSTDRTVDIVNQYKSLDKRVNLIDNSCIPGFGNALNCGIAYAKGDWIGRCDADDVWKPEKLKIQADYIQNWEENEPLVLLGTSGYNINEVGELMVPITASPCTITDFHKQKANSEPFVLFHSSVIFNKDVFHQIGGYRDEYSSALDCDLFTRFSESGIVLNIDRPLFLYRKHLDSMQLNNTIRQMNDLDRIKENAYRRSNGLKELSYEEFIEQAQQKMTKVEQNIHLRMQKGRYLYRFGAMKLANGRYISGAVYLFLAMFYDRKFLFSALKQVVNFKLARTLKL
jgi:glycosyltransferase involved in cell wall biosynthesis